MSVEARVICNDPECGHSIEEHDPMTGCMHCEETGPEGLTLCSCGRSPLEVLAAA